MRPIEFHVENIKRIKAVHLRPEGRLLQICGANEEGKTSLLDGLRWLLTGARDIQSDPIRAGENNADTWSDCGDFVVRRTYTRRDEPGADGKAYTTKLTLTPKVGTPTSGLTPQKLLDSIVGPLSFDPLVFMKAEDKQQYEMLRKLIKGVDFDGIDAANAADLEARKNHNRDIKAKRAAAAQILVPDDVPDEPIDDSVLLGRIAGAAQHNADIKAEEARVESLRSRLIDAKNDYQRVMHKVQDLRREIERLNADAKAIDEASIGLIKQIDEAPQPAAPIDISEVSARLQDARRTNDLVAQKKRRDALHTEVAQLEFLVEDLEASIEARNQKKRDAIASADLGVPCLGLGEDRVYLNGHPINQASLARQIQISLSIAMASNPTLKLIMIREGSSLDSESLAVITRMAEEWDGLVIIERVDESGKVGVVIEDGEVIAINPAVPEAA